MAKIKNINLKQAWQVIALATVLAIVFCFLPYGQGLPVLGVTRTLYWVGDSGEWTNTTHWSNSTGGAGGEAVPDSDDDVIFDANSFTIADQSVMFYNGGGTCHDLTVVACSDTPKFHGFNLSIYGTLAVDNSMAINSGSVTFTSTTNETITWFNPLDPEYDNKGVTMIFNGSGGSWTMQNDLDLRNTGDVISGSITLTAGTLDLNDYDMHVDTFNSSNSNTRSLYLGLGNIYLGDTWTMTTTTNLTFDAETSTINFDDRDESWLYFYGGGLTYYDFYVDMISQNGGGDYCAIYGANTFHDFEMTFHLGSGTTNPENLQFDADQIISNNLTWTGYNSSTKRLRVGSTTTGTNRQITVNGAISITNCDISDIYATGTGDWDISAGLNSDFGGNYGITFTTPVTVYWRGLYGGAANSGSWSDDTLWSSTESGNGGTGRIPLIQDTAIFDETSFSLPGRTVTIDMTYLPEINALDVDENPTFYKSGTVYIYGDFTIGTCSWTVTTTYFSGYDTTLISTGTITSDIYVQKTTATMNQLTLGSDLTFTGTFYLSSGIFNADGYNLTASYFNSSTTTYARVLRMGSGTWTLNGTAATAKWNAAATNLTLYCETSTLILTNSGANAQSFAGAGKTYYTVQITGAGSYTMTFSDANTIGTLYIDRNSAAKTIAGNVTLTLTNFTVPVSGTTVVTITNTDFSKSSGTVGLRYMSISGSAASGGATFFAGAAPPSTDGGGNTGWIFSDGTAPTLETYAAYDVYTSGATLSGGLITMGNFTPVYVFFQYGLSTAFGTNTTEQTMTAPAGFTQQVPSLLQDTTYYFRAVGRYYTDLYAYGDNETFVTELNESYAQNTTSAVGTYGNATGGIPPEPDDLYGELNGTNLVMNITNDVSDSAGMPRTLFWFIFAFLIICLGGIIAYNESRSLALQFIIMLCCLFGFVVGIHILPFWMIFVFIIDGIALMVASRQFGY